MSALTPILSKLATSKVEVIGDGSGKHQAKGLEGLFLERGFVALVGAAQHDIRLCGSCCCSSCSTGNCTPSLCCCCCFA